MKNFLKSTLYLAVFALAGILFQISCSNSDNQTLSTTSTPIGKLVFAKRPTSSDWQIWTCNYDGTNQTQIPITLPTGVVFNFTNLQTNVRLSPDGEKVFFVAVDNTTFNLSIYSCNIDGSNLLEVTPINAGNMELGGAY